MSAEIITTTGRSATTIAIEIRTIHQNAMTSLMVAAVEIGRRLVEAKQLVAHGDWGDYIANQVGYSQSQCNNYMRLYNEYGGKLNSQSIGNLEPTKALALLALPADERESFAEAHKAEELSVSQLKKEIANYKRQADVARETAEKAQQLFTEKQCQLNSQAQLLQLATEENGALRQRLDGIDAEYKAQLEVVDRENDELRAKLEAAQNAPAKISAEQAEKLRAEGRAQAEKELREEFQLAAAEDQEDFDELEAKTKAQAAQIAELERQLTAAKAAPTEVIQGLAKENDAKLAARDERIAELERQLAEKQVAAPAAVPVLAQSDKELIQELFSGIGERFNKLNGLLIKSDGKMPEVAAIIRRMATTQLQNVAKAFGLEVTVE